MNVYLVIGQHSTRTLLGLFPTSEEAQAFTDSVASQCPYSLEIIEYSLGSSENVFEFANGEQKTVPFENGTYKLTHPKFAFVTSYVPMNSLDESRSPSAAIHTNPAACPTCSQIATIGCRCGLFHSICPSGHHFYLDGSGTKRVGNPHQKL